MRVFNFCIIIILNLAGGRSVTFVMTIMVWCVTSNNVYKYELVCDNLYHLCCERIEGLFFGFGLRKVILYHFYHVLIKLFFVLTHSLLCGGSNFCAPTLYTSEYVHFVGWCGEFVLLWSRYE